MSCPTGTRSSIEAGGVIVADRLALLADLAPVLAASHAEIAPAEVDASAALRDECPCRP